MKILAHCRSIAPFLKNLFQNGGPDDLRAHLARGAAGTFLLRSANMVLVLATGMILARALGAEGYGVYAYAFAWLQVFLVVATIGIPLLAVRQLAVYNEQTAWGRMRGFIARMSQGVLLSSLAVALVVGLVIWELRAYSVETLSMAVFLWALLQLPFLALNNIRSGAMQGLDHLLRGQVPEFFLVPAIALVLILAGWAAIDGLLSPEFAMQCRFAAVAVAFSVGALWFFRSLPAPVKTAQPEYETRYWAVSAVPFLLIQLFMILNEQTGTLILGAIGTPEEVGVYHVVTLGARLITFLLAAVNVAIAPSLARMHARGEMERLQGLLTLTVRVTAVLTLPLVIFMILFGKELLTLFFGESYAGGALALAIIVLGQFFSVIIGSVGTLLNATGFQKETANALVFGTLVNALLSLALIPSFGLNGAAIATSASLLIWNAWLAWIVYRRLNVHTTVIGLVAFGRGRG